MIPIVGFKSNRSRIPFVYNYDRLLVLGMSGSGKTYFSNGLVRLIGKHYNYMVFTMKVDDFYPRDHIYIPKSEDLETEINEFVKYGLFHAPITLAWEDIPNYLYGVKKLPLYMKKYLIMGRQVGIGHIFITQKLKGIPTLIPMQSNKYALFKTVDMRDFQLLRLPSIDNLVDIPRYKFYYYDVDKGIEAVL